MFSIANLIDRAKAGGNIDSDYKIADVIGISHQAIYAYRTKNTLPNDKVIAQLCALSGDDVGVIAAQIHAARAKSEDVRSMWTLIAKRLAGGASTAVLSVLFAISLLAGGVQDARASGLSDAQTAKLNRLYIVSSTFFSVVLVRLRQIPGFLRLWAVLGA